MANTEVGRTDDVSISSQKREQYFTELETAVEQFSERFQCNFTPKDRFVTDDGIFHIDGQIQGLEQDDEFIDGLRDELDEDEPKGLIVHNFGFEYYPEGHPDNRDHVELRATGILEVRGNQSGSDYHDLLFTFNREDERWEKPSASFDQDRAGSGSG